MAINDRIGAGIVLGISPARMLLALSVAVLVILALAAAPSLAQPVVTSPAKNAVFLFNFFSSVPASTSTSPLTATIAKGKKGRVVVVEANIDVNILGSSPRTADVILRGPSVNNLGMFGPGFAECSCGTDDCAFGHCVGTGTWWLDLDTAEALIPGTFIGQPLNIEIGPVENNAPGAHEVQVSVTMSARVQKK